MESRSAHRDAWVIEAYKQLQVETDHLFSLVTRSASNRAARVVFTRCVQPYESDEELIFAVRAEGTLEITSAATAGQRLHPLLDCEFGGAFDRFRAVHDLIGHAWCGYGFDLDDECAAWSAQDHLHRGLARFALATELYGVNAARAIIGEPPDLRALLLSPSTRSGRGLPSTRTKFGHVPSTSKFRAEDAIRTPQPSPWHGGGFRPSWSAGSLQAPFRPTSFQPVHSVRPCRRAVRCQPRPTPR